MDKHIITLCLIILPICFDLQVTSIPVSRGLGKSVLDSTLVSSICIMHVNFSATGTIQEPIRNGKQFIYRPMNTNSISWTKCRTQDTECTKFSQTKSNLSFGNISQAVHTRSNNTGSNNGTGKSSRVYGGRPATKNEFPWMVSVLTVDACGQTCGGTILDPITILTAAHCVWNLTNPTVLVVAGSNRIDVYDAGSQSRYVQYYIRHPLYNKTAEEGADLAILKLVSPLIFSSTVNAISFTMDDPQKSPVRAPFTLNGWGTFDNQNISSPFLKTATVYLMPRADCDLIFDTNEYPLLEPFEFCTGYSLGTGLCTGDSGGGLIQIIGGVPWLAGVVAHTQDCGFTPSVFTNAFIMKSWVLTNM